MRSRDATVLSKTRAEIEMSKDQFEQAENYAKKCQLHKSKWVVCNMIVIKAPLIIRSSKQDETETKNIDAA